MYEFQTFTGSDGLWYWRLWSIGNRKTIAVAGEGFFSEWNARRSIETVKAVAPTAPVRTLG